jgi:pimeloyl-ACP methyl ester carboxylesterase
LAVSIASQRLESWDGTEITWYEAGDPDAPPMVFCGGLGGGVMIWRPLFERFAERFRLLSFDYRGLYASGRAPHSGAYDLIHHVRDLVQLLEHTGARSPILMGWSMGVQVGLELHRDHPERLAALVAIHGTAGRPLATAFDSSFAEQAAPFVLGALRAAGTRFAAVGPALARNPVVVHSFVGIARRLGYMAPTIDVAAFQEMAEAWTRLDLDAYARIFEALGAHDATDLLPAVRTPTLVVAGDADRFTPLAVSEQMVERMSDAALAVIPGATHFGLMERPAEIVDAVDRFVAERVERRGRARRQPRAPRQPQPLASAAARGAAP